MKRRPFLAGFLACYALAGFTSARNAAEIPATTRAGVAYSFFMWAPLNLLPEKAAVAIVPAWAFNFEESK